MTLFLKLQSFGFFEPFAEYLCNRKMGVAAVFLNAFPVLSKPISKNMIAKDQHSGGRGIILLLQTLGVHSVQ